MIQLPAKQGELVAAQIPVGNADLRSLPIAISGGAPQVGFGKNLTA
jgi:hypothetical protein